MSEWVLKRVCGLDTEQAYRAMWRELGLEGTVCGLPERVWLDRFHAQVSGPTLNVIVRQRGQKRGQATCGLLRAELGDFPGMFSNQAVTYVRDVWIGRAVRRRRDRTYIGNAYLRALEEWMALHRSTFLWCNAVHMRQRRLWSSWGLTRGAVMQGIRGVVRRGGQ